jgi:hypothetical protein
MHTAGEAVRNGRPLLIASGRETSTLQHHLAGCGIQTGGAARLRYDAIAGPALRIHLEVELVMPSSPFLSASTG